MNNIGDSPRLVNTVGRVSTVEESRNVTSELSELPAKTNQEATAEDASDRPSHRLSAVQFIKRRLRSFAREVSIVGLYMLTVPSRSTTLSFVRTVVWTSLFLFGVAVMLQQIQERCSYYYSRPTSAIVRIEQNRSLRFPSVTICNENRVSRAASQKLGIIKNYFNLCPKFPITDRD